MRQRTTVEKWSGEVGARGYINDKWHHMTRALKLDKKMNKRLKTCSLTHSSEVQLLLVRMLASSRVVHYKTPVLGSGEIINGEFSKQQFLLQIEKSPAGAGRVYGGESMRYLVYVMVGIRSP